MATSHVLIKCDAYSLHKIEHQRLSLCLRIAVCTVQAFNVSIPAYYYSHHGQSSIFLG
jgi:hypothetical protein